MHACAERGEHADPPVAELVTKPFDDDGAVVGHRAGGLGLAGDVVEEVAGGALVQAGARAQPFRGDVLSGAAQLAHHRTHGRADLVGSAHGVPVPERHLSRLARRGKDQHLLGGDVDATPAGGAEDEDLAGTQLVHHLLVELADAPAVLEDVDAVQAAIGDSAAAGDSEALRAGATAHGSRNPVPHDARAQLAELLGWVARRRACRAWPRRHVG